MATAEQQRADEDVVKLVRDQNVYASLFFLCAVMVRFFEQHVLYVSLTLWKLQREKVADLNKILELEQKLEAKQTLE